MNLAWLFNIKDKRPLENIHCESQTIWRHRAIYLLKLLGTPGMRKGNRKCAQHGGGGGIDNQNRFEKKKVPLLAPPSPPPWRPLAEAATPAPAKRLLSLPSLPDLASSASAPAAAPLLGATSRRPGAAERGGRCAATHPSRSGWPRAGIREGCRAPDPEDADMWLEPPLP